MPISITSTARENGPACNHLIVTIDHEGVARTFKTSFAEIDALPMAVEDLRDFLLRWAKYRRLMGRAILNVEIA